MFYKDVSLVVKRLRKVLKGVELQKSQYEITNPLSKLVAPAGFKPSGAMKGQGIFFAAQSPGMPHMCKKWGECPDGCKDVIELFLCDDGILWTDWRKYEIH